MYDGRKTVYDIGAHIGRDTAYYLSRGYRVIAVEADPSLVDFLRNQFGRFVERKLLTVIHAAICDSNPGEVDFFISGETGESSLYPERMIEAGSKRGQVKVPACGLGELFESFGKGYYCKIDIEGGDLPALKSLLPEHPLPDFFSVELSGVPISELATNKSSAFAALEELTRLGYSRFKLVDQFTLATLDSTSFYSRQRTLAVRLKKKLFRVLKVHTPAVDPRGWYSRHQSFDFTIDSSGVFGDDLLGDWKSGSAIREIIAARLEEYLQYEKSKPYHIFWVDLHATR